MVFGGCSQKLKLRIILLPLTQSHQKILAILGTVLSSMLNHSLFSFRQLLRDFSDIFLWIWLLELHKNFIKEFLLLIFNLDLFLFFLGFNLLNSFFLFGLFRSHTLKQLFANLSDPMIVVGSEGTIRLQKSKLLFLLFSLHENFFEGKAIGGNMLGSLLQ